MRRRRWRRLWGVCWDESDCVYSKLLYISSQRIYHHLGRNSLMMNTRSHQPAWLFRWISITKEQEEVSTRMMSTSMVACFDDFSQYSSSPLIERMSEPPYHPRQAAASSGYCKADRPNQGRGEVSDTTLPLHVWYNIGRGRAS